MGALAAHFLPLLTQTPSHWSLIPYPLSLTMPHEPDSTRNS
jgi:hypothetical protein